MSNKLILATLAVAALSASCLVPTEASARGGGAFRGGGGGFHAGTNGGNRFRNGGGFAFHGPTRGSPFRGGGHGFHTGFSGGNRFPGSGGFAFHRPTRFRSPPTYQPVIIGTGPICNKYGSCSSLGTPVLATPTNTPSNPAFPIGKNLIGTSAPGNTSGNPGPVSGNPPGNPGKPGNPNNPGKPGNPKNPSKPGNSNNPGNPIGKNPGNYPVGMGCGLLCAFAGLPPASPGDSDNPAAPGTTSNAPTTSGTGTGTTSNAQTTYGTGSRRANLVAIALGWNAGGYWVAQKAATVVDAGQTALSKCNDQFGSCQLSDVMVPPTQFACMAVARAMDDPTKLLAAVGGSIGEARQNVSNQLSNANLQGMIEYSDCNGASQAAL